MRLAAPDADEARRIQRSGVGDSGKRGPDGFAKTLFEIMNNSTRLLAIDILPEGWQLGCCRGLSTYGHCVFLDFIFLEVFIYLYI